MSTDKQPTIEAVIDDRLAHLDFGATTTPLPDKFGHDYKALHDHYIALLTEEVNAAPDITGKDTFEVNQRLRIRLRDTRNGLDRTRMAMFEPMRNLKAQVDAYIGTNPDSGLQGRIKELERIIQAKQDAWEAEQERIRQEALRKIQERNEARARRLIDAGMVFNGSCYELLDLRVFQVDVEKPSDEDFDAWFTGVVLPVAETKREADRIKEVERIEAERSMALEAAGYRRSAETGHYELAEDEGRACTPIESLSGMSEDDFGALVRRGHQMLEERKAKKEAEQRAENERLQTEFKRQAEEKRKQDEERAAIDAEREKLKAERLDHRMHLMRELGAVGDPTVDGMWVAVEPEDPFDTEFGVERALYSYSYIRDCSPEQWEETIADVKAKAERFADKQQEYDRQVALVKSRSAKLIEIGAVRDEAGIFTLGDASTTAHVLKIASAEEWEPIEQRFIEERAKVSTALAVDEKEGCGLTDEDGIALENLAAGCDTSDSPFAELLACSLALLDESTKAFTIHGSEERYSEALAKIQAHAGDCVRIARELQS